MLIVINRDIGVNVIEFLMEKKGKFDYILFEIIGLVDLGNLVLLFWVDDGLVSIIYLDGIVIFVDVKNIFCSLDDFVGKVEGYEDFDDYGLVMIIVYV